MSSIPLGVARIHLVTFGIALAIWGIGLLYSALPPHQWQEDGSTPETDARQAQQQAEMSNGWMRIGVIAVAVGSVMQMVAALLPQTG